MKKFLFEKIYLETFFSDQKYCFHDIIQDYIDLTPEKGQTIYYCNKCMADFTNLLLHRR
jgi:hypothetical protein